MLSLLLLNGALNQALSIDDENGKKNKENFTLTCNTQLRVVQCCHTILARDW